MWETASRTGRFGSAASADRREVLQVPGIRECPGCGVLIQKQGPKARERSGDPNPQCFSKSTAVQMGDVLPYKWEVYRWLSLSSRLRSQESAAIQMGGVLPYKWGVYCRTFWTGCTGWVS